MQKDGKNNRCVILTAIGINKSVVESVSITKSDIVIAADGGMNFAVKYGITPNILIGDMDSIKTNNINISVEKYSSEKDDTDTMLAIYRGIQLGCTDFVILGGTGGRLSHTISNMQCLKYLYNNNCSGTIISNDCDIYYLCNNTIIINDNCKYFSLITLNNIAKGITIKNAKYELYNSEMTNSVPLGISNELIGMPAEVSVEDGELYVLIEKN